MNKNTNIGMRVTNSFKSVPGIICATETTWNTKTCRISFKNSKQTNTKHIKTY